MTRDTLARLRQNALVITRGAVAFFMQSSKTHARWHEAIKLTLGLWLFVLLTFMPLIVARHADGSIKDVILDSVTIFLSISLALVLFALFRATVDWSNRRRIAVMGVAVALVATANATFDLVYTVWIAQNLQASWAALPSNISRGYSAAFNYLLVFSVNLAFFQMSFSRRRALATERQLADARSAAQQAQLTALRYQLNPHFLFNALNSISALIVTNRNNDAEEMTDRLSSFLRASLACDPTSLIPLEEELGLTEEYLEIEAVRFADRLQVTIECEPEAAQALVPGFLVQPLVENAIKHGVAPSCARVTIAIRAAVEDEDLCITVENGRVEGDASAAGLGVGLANVRQRLQAVYGSTATMAVEPRADSFCVTICIPKIKR
jgi:hypothetical protein